MLKNFLGNWESCSLLKTTQNPHKQWDRGDFRGANIKYNNIPTQTTNPLKKFINTFLKIDL